MLDHILAKKTSYNGIVIDTNLLLLFLIGIFDIKLVEKARKIRKYSLEDFHKLISIVDYFGNSITLTPNILTEVCNHSENLNQETDFKFFKNLEQLLLKYSEHHEPSSTIISKNQTCFYKLGLTDSTILNLARQNTLVITDDLPLYHFLTSQNFDAINYNQLILL